MAEPELEPQVVACSSCSGRWPLHALAPVQQEMLRRQVPYQDFLQEIQMLERVQSLYERFPEVEDRIRPPLSFVLHSTDPRIQEQLFSGVPFDQIELPLEALEIPLPPEVIAQEREVIDYLQTCEFSLGPRMAFVKERLGELGESQEPIHCPECHRGWLKLEQAEAEDAAEQIVFYYPSPESLQPDGSLHIRCSGYTTDSHWSGYQEVAPESSDHAFWRWLIERHEDFQGVSSEDLDELRAEYRLLHGDGEA